MDNRATNSNLLYDIFLACSLVSVLLISGCVDNSGKSIEGASRPWAFAPPVEVVPITLDILSLADAGGGNVVVSTSSTPESGDTVLISGTANYDGTYTADNVVTGSKFEITANFLGTESGIWQLTGGAIPGCNTTGDTGAINLVTNVSRFDGVAPLAVYFDASGTTTIPSSPRPFHDLGYSWNFGDQGPSAGTWPTGSKPGVSSRNIATGPMAAHVFESPGTYTVTLDVTDGTGAASNSCIRIAVLDPDIVFAGNNTICFSTTGNFANAPPGTCTVPGLLGTPGATAIQTDDFPGAINTYQATGKRLLFRRGEVWNATGVATINANGPGLVGAYGTTPSRPRIVKAGGQAKVIKLSTSSTPNLGDWRIMDLDIDGGGIPHGDNSAGVGGGGGARQLTMLRLDIRNIAVGFSFSSELLDFFNDGSQPGHALWDQIAIADSFAFDMIGGSGGNGMYLNANRLMLLGNTVTNTVNAEHNIRIQFVNQGVIEHSNFAMPSHTKALLTVRAAPFGNTGVTSPGITDKVVIADNRFLSDSDQTPITIWPSGANADHRITNVIFERNLYLAGSGTQVALSVSASEVTVRNNLFNMTGGTAGRCMSFSRRGELIPIQDQIRVCNNTCYSNSGHAFRMVILDEGLDSVSIKNNLAWAPNSEGVTVMLDDRGPTPNLVGGAGIFGNSSNSNIANTDPKFVNGSGTFLLATDFNLEAGGPAINAGLTSPADGNAPQVRSDFFLVSRPRSSSTDMGATEQ